MWQDTERARAGDRDIHLLSNLHQVGSVQINVFQRVATRDGQKSLREGFGLTVSEALWKGRPVSAVGAAGSSSRSSTTTAGISSTASKRREADHRPARRSRRCRRDGLTGARARAVELPRHPRAPRLVAAAQRAPVTAVVLSHRGPYRYEEGPDGEFGAARGGGPGQRPRPAAPLRGRRDHTWIAAALTDADRAAAEAGAVDDTRHRPPLLDLDPDVARVAYEVVSNGTLWFLYHGLFDLPVALGSTVGAARRGRPTRP